MLPPGEHNGKKFHSVGRVLRGRSVGLSVCLSVVCHIRAHSLSRSTDSFPNWQVLLRGPMTHCVRWGSGWTPREGEIRWSNSHPKHAIANCCCYLANANEKRFRFCKLLWCLFYTPLCFRVRSPYGTDGRTDRRTHGNISRPTELLIPQ